MSAKPNPRPDSEFAPADFFAFRTPLLPFEEIERFSSGLTAARTGDDPEERRAALAEDRRVLRERLAALLARPEVEEALFIASPSLFEALDLWRKDPDGKKGLRAERALVRYLLRMASRATPFGLFSGCSLGRVDLDPEAPTRLTVGPRASYERHTRLDMDYLFALCEDLCRNPDFQSALLFRPNSSLYRAAGRLRYAEARMEQKVRSHHLVAVEATDYLEDTLRRAENGARAAELARALVESDPDGEITEEDANEFLRELIDSQVLVSDLTPPVTGPEAIHDLVAQLSTLPPGGEACRRLAEVRDVLAELDARGPGAPTGRYREIAASLEELKTPVEIARLFQLDMVKPGDREAPPSLGGNVLAEIERAVALLYRLGGRARHEGLEKFVKDFNERYEGQEVPLLEALDEEIGIGFERSAGAGAEASPLLRGVVLAGPPGEQTVPWGTRQAFMLTRLHEALATDATRIEITNEDWKRLAPEASDGNPSDRASLPDAFQVMATLAAPSEEAFQAGDFKVLFEGAGGPSGARLLGRFCHADPALTRGVEDHLRAEEAHRPDAIFAEIVHLPQGRIGNILSRPVLRRHEIAFLGRSGAAPEDTIPVSDLLVSVLGSRIVLRSARLGKEVIPRLTSAHNFSMRSLGVYRFLCTLQTQGILGGLGWNWGALDSSPYLPRVESGRLVLSRACWWITADEIKPLKEAKGPEARFEAAQALRTKRRLPRYVTLGDGDNELLVDWDNALSVDTLVDVIEDRDRARLFELFPGPDELFARGPEGRFVHEIVVPFVRKPQERPAARGRRGLGETPAIRRSFPPGSEWLYAKLYTGTSTADGLLVDAVGPVVHEALATGAADGWFFIRYSDPEWHLRLRLHGDPHALAGQVVPQLEKVVAPLLSTGKLWKMQFDTYEREVERYGGSGGIELSEKLFEADSEAVLAILGMLEGDEGADARWRLALLGSDRLLTDLGLEGEERLAVLRGMKESFHREFGGGKGLRVQMDQRFRSEKRSLETLLDPARAAESPLAPGIEVLDRRSTALAPMAAELRRREAAGELNQSVAELVPSYIHMYNNRMIRSAGRAHELLIYDFLYQLYMSRAARERGKAQAQRA